MGTRLTVRTADAGVSGGVAAIQVREYICVPENGPAVDEHEAARMLSDLETGPLELDEPLEGFKGWIEPLPEAARAGGPRAAESEASTSDASTPRSTTKTSAVRASSSTELMSSSLATSKGTLKPSRSTAVASIRSRTGLAPMYPIVASDGRDGERVGDERQDVAGVVRQLEGHPGGVRRRSRPRTASESRRPGRRRSSGPDRSRIGTSSSVDVGEAPSVPLSRQLGPIDFDDEPIEIVRDLPRPVVDGVLAVVVAVVPGEALSEALDRAAVEEHPPAQVRVDVIAEQHLLVEPVDRQEVLAKDQLKIAGRIEADPLVAHRRLVQTQARAEALDLGHRATAGRSSAAVPRATRGARIAAGRRTRPGSSPQISLKL